MKRKERRSYKFTEKKHSKKSMIAIGVGAISQILFLVFIYLSYQAAGQLSTYFGAVGVMSMVASVVSFLISSVAIKEEDIFPLYPKIAMAVTGVSALCWAGLYLIGFLRG